MRARANRKRFALLVRAPGLATPFRLFVVWNWPCAAAIVSLAALVVLVVASVAGWIS